MTAVTSIDDLKRLYQRRVPRMFFDYTESGSWTEQTFQANERHLQGLKFKQRVLVDISDRDLASAMLGQPVTMPVALASWDDRLPAWWRKIKAARAAAQFQVPYALTMSICSIEV